MSKSEEYVNRQNGSWQLSLRRLFDTGHLRGCIGERMVELYVNDELIPSLKKKEGWSDILYVRAWYQEPRSVPTFDEYRSPLTEGLGVEARKDLWERMKMNMKGREK